MNPAQRAQLTKALSAHVAAIAADLRAQMLVEGSVRERARRLHSDEQVGDDFDVWTDLLSRRAAVLWVLKTVYIRVLEDRGLLRPERLLDPEAQQLFEKLAPNLGEAAFLSWLFRDLASPHGGLPELFAPQPAEVAVPADTLSRALIGFWRSRDADTGFQWSFADEEFAGELMGDLYQELDPVVKDRYALCQTPDFVRDFMLGQTLEPAIKELGADQVRLLDPACGSGHFLLDAVRRLVDATAAQHPDWSRRLVVDDVLDRVVGIDLNDYACALARSRLIMTAAELAGVESLAEAAHFIPNIHWGDGLEQLESDDERLPIQLDFYRPGVTPPPRAVLTRPHVRALLRPILKRQFHVVVGNPPYISERDPARKDYHRELVCESGERRRRYLSAYREYSLAAPFVERSFQLTDANGWIGLIVSNNFMKREFGKPLIEKVLANIDLQLIVDTSQVRLFGTPTAILFARKRSPDPGDVRAVMGKRGEAGTPAVPAKSKVWRSIVEGFAQLGFENEFVSVAAVRREILRKHPWSLGGGGASELRVEIEQTAPSRLGDLAEAVGLSTNLKQSEVYESYPAALKSGREIPLVDMVIGERVRDFAISGSHPILFPYDVRDPSIPLQLSPTNGARNHFWRYRGLLLERRSTGFKTIRERGLLFYEYAFHFPQTYLRPTITFSFVATHNHFVLRAGGCVFKQSAPVIQLPQGATENHHLALLGLLNSSAGCFWMKQVFHCKGSQGVNEGAKSELWEQFYEFDATKLKLFPIPDGHLNVVPWARELDRLAQARAARSVESILGDTGWTKTAELRALLDARREADLTDLARMVALQEELDWECYRIYGIDPDAKGGKPEQVDSIRPNWRPVELNLAVRDGEIRAAIERGDETTEIPTMWFERHSWEPLTELPAEAPPPVRDLTETRRARIEAIPKLGLIEQTTYKRRWYRPDYVDHEQKALLSWLADRVERELSAQGGKAYSVAQLTSALEGHPRVHAVAELLSGRRDYRLIDLIAERIAADSVPQHPFHVYKPVGLEKRAAWERTWEEQRKEDARQPANPNVPPNYSQSDFLRPEYFRLRGKLDVPRERFIALTEVPGRGAGETLYGWAGWTPTQRVRALLAIDEECEDQDIPLGDRIALVDSAWRLIPDIMRDDPATGARLKAELQALVGPDGPSKVLLDDWERRFPPPGKGRVRGKKVKEPRPAARADEEDE